jgi:DNA-binding NarL/FixJ family response regulator
VPFEEGKQVATLIPGARFVPLESRNHVLLETEPAFRQCFDEIRAFVAEHSAPEPHGSFQKLTPRERQLLELLAHGLDNLQLAAHLGVSEKTVRNKVSAVFDKLHVTTRAQAIVLARNAGFGTGPLVR